MKFNNEKLERIALVLLIVTIVVGTIAFWSEMIYWGWV
jgi:hypothetical protein